VEPPLAVLSLTTVPPPEVEPERPPDAPAPSIANESLPAPALALPALDLPLAPVAPDALRLPDLSPGPTTLDLPIRVPALASVDPAGVAAAPPAPPAGDAGDGEARLESAMDLDRHYPRAARQRGITGTSTLRVTIDAEGRVAAVEVLASEPPGMFEAAARRLAGSLRYTPARRGGAAVATVQTLTIAWTLR
jgi:protein TonB